MINLPVFEKVFQRFIHQQQLFSPSDRILLAVSGGIDSMVMAELFHLSGYSFGMAHCNFGLRGKESDRDELLVRKLGKKLKIPVFVRQFQPDDFTRLQGLSIQMAARELRYQWFEEIRSGEGFDYIATAHHLDDQIETFFINLIRGTGISGLHGILPKQGKLIRPMLFSFRSDIKSFACQNNIAYRDDSSNESVKYLRNKIRHELIPVLKEINPDLLSGMTETIHRIRDFEMIGEKEIRARRKEVIKTETNRITIDIQKLRTLHPLQSYAWEFLSPFGFNPTQINDIVASLEKESGKKFGSPTHHLIKDRKKLIIVPASGLSNRKTSDNAEGKGCSPDKKCVFFIEKKARSIDHPICLKISLKKISSKYQIPSGREYASLDFNKLEFPLILRRWNAGDAFFPYGMNKKKKLSDFFIDQKFSLDDKVHTWLLCSGSKIVWVVGHRIDHRFRITTRTRNILRLSCLNVRS